jgi:hypothetical protein
VFYLCNELQFAIVIRHREFDIPLLQFLLYVLYIWFASNFVIKKLGMTPSTSHKKALDLCTGALRVQGSYAPWGLDVSPMKDGDPQRWLYPCGADFVSKQQPFSIFLIFEPWLLFIGI